MAKLRLSSATTFDRSSLLLVVASFSLYQEAVYQRPLSIPIDFPSLSPSSQPQFKDIDMELHSLSPRMQELLLTNELPEDTEIASFLQLLHERKRELSELDAQIAQARQLPDRSMGRHLVARRWKTQQMVGAYMGAVSPIRRLPLELVSRILVFCADVDMFERDAMTTTASVHSYHEESWHHRFDRAPWSLSRISRAWRSAALFTAEIWSYVAITIFSPVTYNTFQNSVVSKQHKSINRAGELELLRLQLARSDELVSRSSRWESLCVTMEQDDRGMLLDQIKDRLPTLQRLHWHIGGSTPNFDDIPRLNTLIISPPNKWDREFPFMAHLTELTLWFPSEIIDLKMLQWMPMLETLNVAGHSFSSRNTAPITLCHLRRIFLELPFELSESRTIFSRLTAPQLEVLTIVGYSGNKGGETVELKEMLDRSGCSLRELHLGSLGLVQDSFIQLLRCIPTLVKLSMNGSGETLDSGQVLAIQVLAQDSECLPSLQRLNVGRKEEAHLKELQRARTGLKIYLASASRRFPH
ncbi:hypothetical protein C8J56DRAFT_941558 [Mycena floridula]|nr:hypothetical protein C8J56DRAFT_941558 [Mycena floridula]